MNTFADFIKSRSDLTDHQRKMYLFIDKRAEKPGREIAATHTVAELRAKTGTPFIVGLNQMTADALEADPSGKLATYAMQCAYAGRRNDIGVTWVRWWLKEYRAWLRATGQALAA